MNRVENTSFLHNNEFPLLKRIDRPEELRQLSAEELDGLVEELRRKIVQTVALNGGHLASPLGVVELTVALCYTYDFENDTIVWDVGHQSYAYKILTGRRDQFSTLRTEDGISGYPRPSESRFDSFGTGHSSTSISAALGMAEARDRNGEDRHVIAVIGDGAMTGGMAWEALSHAGHLGTNLLVILNDNEMSIAKNVGALSAYFNRLITARSYRRAKEDVASFVKGILGPRLSETAHRLEVSVKGFLTAGGVFQELGFNYLGPVDGHDLPALLGLFERLKTMHGKSMTGPVLLHCVTQKGRGFSDAEKDPLAYHGVKPLQVAMVEKEGEARPPDKVSPPPKAKTFTDVFAEALIEAAENDKRVIGITAAMPTGTGLSAFQERFPEQFYDVGICEQHSVTFAAGLAARGMRPVCAIYSTFLQRGYDQLIHDVCLQNLPVVFAVDRAGLVGEDGATHAGSFDLSYLRAIPNLRVLAPRDDVDLRAMLKWALYQDGPVAIRYPRDTAPTIGSASGRDITRGEILSPGADGIFLGLGSLVGTCLAASERLHHEGISVGVADARLAKPLDTRLLDEVSSLPIMAVEENVLAGGFGSAVMEYYEQKGVLPEVRIARVGLPDAFCEHAKRSRQLTLCGLDAVGLADAMRTFLVRTVASTGK